MQSLIGDLLHFSRANTEKRKLERISLPKLKQEIEKELSSLLVDQPAQLKWQLAADHLIADYIKLKQILENLITNGLKFTRPDQQACLEIRLMKEPHRWVFSVQDNGIGIAQEFQEKIFLIFKRLYTQNEYKGTGIGLALVKRLVEQHEGSIWLKSTPDQGSTFYFAVAKELVDG